MDGNRLMVHYLSYHMPKHEERFTHFHSLPNILIQISITVSAYVTKSFRATEDN